ncbi:unnamed protein product [Calicophoron daubneyi]|uniref:Protein kinase domain-containing protein n=1 Tax=Calicophoron daubneyi TaxID=300641 RepID=A0AAV2TS69_CALDB
MENFVLYDEIGKANEQTIYKARRKGTIRYLAISCAERQRRPLISNHVRFVHVLKHKNVLQFLEWYETSNHLWLVMELCTGGSLEQVIKEDGSLPEAVVGKFGADITRGLQYVHSRGVLFNDMKPSRFLLDGNGTVKLFDFSLAHLENESLDEVLMRFNDEDELGQNGNVCELHPTSAYTAPEVLKDGTMTMASDYWGLGCLLYLMFTGQALFSGDTPEQLSENILYDDFLPLRIPGKKPSFRFLSLLEGLLNRFPARRLSPSRLEAHEFWQDNLKGETPVTGSDVETAETQSNVPMQRKYSISIVRENEVGMNGVADSLDGLRPSTTGSEDEKKSEIKIRRHTVADRPSNPSQPLVINVPPSGVRGEGANFTLHATSNMGTASPVSTVEETVNNMSRVTLRRNDQDGEQWQPNYRMVQSEYNCLSSGNDQEKDHADVNKRERSNSGFGDVDSSFLHNINDAKFAPHPVSPETRANLALTYLWGDDSPNLPYEPKLLVILWNYLHGGITDLENISLRTRKMSVGAVGSFPIGWRPRQLMDYGRWARSPPPTRVDGINNPLNEAKLRLASAGQIEQAVTEAFGLFCKNATESAKGRSTIRSSRATLLSYLLWLMSSVSPSVGVRTSCTVVRKDSTKNVELSHLPDFFVEVTKQLKASASLHIDVRTGLCRLCALLAHRIAHLVYRSPHDTGSLDFPADLLKPVIPSLSTCLTSLIEILREPISRTGFSIRYTALFALGEVVTCLICLMAKAAREAESARGPKGDSTAVDIQASHWQTVVHYLLRCLSSSSAASTLSIVSPGLEEKSLSNGPVDASNGGEAAEMLQVGVNTAKLTEAHVRLSAARSMDAIVTAILGCQLHDLSVQESVMAPVTACLNAIISPEVVSRLWSDGLTESGSGVRRGFNSVQRNQLHQEISLSCASALAGIIRINPALFTSGLIDRIGSAAFTSLLESPPGGPACQQTSLVVRLLSMAASGLLIPLAQKTTTPGTGKMKRASVTSTGIGIGVPRQPFPSAGGAGTPAACRRLLTDQRFILAVFRHLESPHAMLRAKAYLICAAILTTSPRESIPVAFDSHLLSYLERDLKATSGLQSKYVDMQSTSTMFGSSGRVTGTPSMIYLAACTLYFLELLVNYLIPLICQQILIALGCLTWPPCSGRPGTNRFQTPNTGRKTGRSNSTVGPNRGSNLIPASSTSALNVVSSAANINAARAWLPSFCCLSGVISMCGTVRDRLFTKQGTGGDESDSSEFCLLAFLGRLLDFWASVDQTGTANGIASIHQPSSVENQLLNTALTITEDLSQQPELVEAKRRDFICLILPGLARLAVVPGALPETRAICVKIVMRLSEHLLGESTVGASTQSLDEIGRDGLSERQGRTSVSPESGNRPLSADIEQVLRCVEIQEGRKRTQSTSDLLDTKQISDYMSSSQYGELYPKRTEKRMGHSTLGSAVQPPTPDALKAVVDVVNKLIIPYADRLIKCSEVTAPTAFIRLLNLLMSNPILTSASKNNQFNLPTTQLPTTAQGDCPANHPPISPTIEAACNAVRSLVANLSTHGLDVAIVRLLASVLLWHSNGESPRLNKTAGSVASVLSLSLFNMVPLLLRWPEQSRPSHLIIDLRLLELISIACLELGELLLPNCFSTEPSAPNSNDKSPPKQKLNAKRLDSRNGSRSKDSEKSPTSYEEIIPMEEPNMASKHLTVPLLAALEAMNALLNHVADVVRIALAHRSASSPEAEKSAMDAEEILIAARPPPTLAGFLARLIGLWRPRIPGQSAFSNARSNLVNNVSTSERIAEDEVCFQLCDAAITGLTNFASLYGGEYSRSALEPAAAASLSLGLLRLAEEDQKAQQQLQDHGTSSFSPNSTKARHSGPQEDGVPNKQGAVQCRRRLRLLLRIIRRLVFSDHVCRTRLGIEATERGVINLYTTLNLLSKKVQRNADASTLKLLREIIDFVSPASRFNRDPSRPDHSRTRGTSRESSTSANRIGSTAAA